MVNHSSFFHAVVVQTFFKLVLGLIGLLFIQETVTVLRSCQPF